MICELGNELWFPPPETADASGLLAIGGDVRPERLVLAYAQGIFPWPSDGMPLLWFSPDPRFVLPLDALRVGRSLRKRIRANRYRIAADQRFAEVIRACQTSPRPGQDGTWITDELVEGYCSLHALGYAHSIEAYQGSELVGGLYGVSLGRTFFGESMFSQAPDASKVALVALAGTLKRWGVRWIDCQMETPVFRSLGARTLPRRKFLSMLRTEVAQETRKGKWTLPITPVEALDEFGR